MTEKAGITRGGRNGTGRRADFGDYFFTDLSGFSYDCFPWKHPVFSDFLVLSLDQG
jgi:hypothetical protein